MNKIIMHQAGSGRTTEIPAEQRQVYQLNGWIYDGPAPAKTEPKKKMAKAVKS